MDGIVLLQEDHKTVNGLFREFEKIKDSGTPAARHALIDKIIEELPRTRTSKKRSSTRRCASRRHGAAHRRQTHPVSGLLLSIRAHPQV